MSLHAVALVQCMADPVTGNSPRDCTDRDRRQTTNSRSNEQATGSPADKADCLVLERCGGAACQKCQEEQ